MKTKVLAALFGSLGIVALTASPAMAQSVDITDPGVFADNSFVLICAVLVVFMQAGFAMVETGLTRAKNAAHMMLKNMLDFVVGSIGFALIGYHLAFNGSAYFGFDWLWSTPDAAAPGAPNLTMPVHFLFNMAFAAAAATIVSGAVAERAKFKAYFIYAIVISSFIYPVVVSWVWGGGFLSRMDTPFVDFAGSGVVHVTGGMCALVGAKIIGPRIGRFDEDGTPRPIPGHNVPTAILGVFILLIGWFGFNSGSLLSAGLQVGSIAVVTALGAGAGGMGATITSWLTVKTPDVTLIGNGVLGGLVAITAGALNLSLFGALVTGFMGGVIASYGVLLLDRFRIDDPVGAIPVHLFCGTWGVIAVGLLADPDAVIGGDGPQGFLYGGSPALLVSQIWGLLVIMTFVGACSSALFLVMRERDMLRVSVEEEMLGMDLAEHATPAYNDDVTSMADVAEFDDVDFDTDWLDEIDAGV